MRKRGIMHLIPLSIYGFLLNWIWEITKIKSAGIFNFRQYFAIID